LIEIGLRAKGEMIMKVLVGLAGVLFTVSATLAQSPQPKALPAPAKPHSPMGCKLVGTVKGTKLWAGDCSDAVVLRGSDHGESQSLAEQAGAAIPPGQKQ
jgi:hypothetical protein